MKKVFILSNMYPSRNHLSFGIFVKNQVDVLKEHNISVITGVNQNPNTGKINVLKKYVQWTLNVLIKGLRDAKHIGISHAHYVFPTGLLSLLLKITFGIPYVVTAHGGDIDKMAKKNKWIRKVTLVILKEAAHVIAVGEELAETIKKDFLIPHHKVSVMSMGVNRKVFKEGDQEKARNDLNLPLEPYIYLFVGNLIKEKGVSELINAFQQLNEPNSLLYIIGSKKSSQFVDQLYTEVEPDFKDSIHFIDPIPQNDLVKWFQASNVFVLPSYIEGFGLVALEALACKIPVIASRVGGLAYLLRDGVGHFVKPQDSEGLYLEMQRALKTPREQYYVDEAVEKVLIRNDQEILTIKLIELYKNHSKI